MTMNGRVGDCGGVWVVPFEYAENLDVVMKDDATRTGGNGRPELGGKYSCESRTTASWDSHLALQGQPRRQHVRELSTHGIHRIAKKRRQRQRYNDHRSRKSELVRRSGVSPRGALHFTYEVDDAPHLFLPSQPRLAPPVGPKAGP